MRFGVYALISSAVAFYAIFHAWSTRIQFYPTVVFLTTNKLSLVALGNWGLVMTLGFGKVVRGIFLGPLRDIELEVMYENARFATIETCLALTVFRPELTAITIFFLTGLLFVKAFHWLAQARVEHLEQAGAHSTVSMTRLACLTVLNLVVDLWMVAFCIEVMAPNKLSVNILFAFEFAILSIAAFSTAVKLLLHVIDSNIAGAWHAKTTWIMLLEFFSEVFRFTFFLMFFLVMVTLYSMPPLHLIRDIYVSFAQIQRRLHAFYRYRQLASNMDQRFPDATEAELEQCEYTCIICRDTMNAGKKLPCSHIFHLQCLRLWLQQQQACPTCRANIPTDVNAAPAAAAVARAQAEVDAARRGGPGERGLAELLRGLEDNAGVAGANAGVAGANAGVAGADAGVAGANAEGGADADANVDANVGGAAQPALPRAAGQANGVAVAVAGARPVALADPTLAAARTPVPAPAQVPLAPVAPSERAQGASQHVESAGDMPRTADGVSPGRMAWPGFGPIGANWERAIAESRELTEYIHRYRSLRLINTGVPSVGREICGALVVEPRGVPVRKGVEQDSPVARYEGTNTVLLLVGPQAPCGSFRVQGGWVGGPGHEDDVRLVNLHQPIAMFRPRSEASCDNAASSSWLPSVPPGVNDSNNSDNAGSNGEEKHSSVAEDAPQATQVLDAPNLNNGIERGSSDVDSGTRESLRRRLVGRAHQSGDDAN